jgi:hypothetical protein
MKEEKNGEWDKGNRQRPPSVDERNRENRQGEESPGKRGAVHDVAENPGLVEVERIRVRKGTISSAAKQVMATQWGLLIFD